MWIISTHDDKYEDIQGVRKVLDNLEGVADYDEQEVSGPLCWPYKLCVMCGVLVGVDPLLTDIDDDTMHSFSPLEISLWYVIHNPILTS